MRNFSYFRLHFIRSSKKCKFNDIRIHKSKQKKFMHKCKFMDYIMIE
jgi:hypothetical protein